jgi:hypothetical protein
MAEVAIHLDSLNYGGYATTVDKGRQKVAAARAYAALVYREVTPTLEFWSPVVPAGRQTALAQLDVELVTNEAFTGRVNELADRARQHTKMTGDDAYRLL